MYQHRAPDEIGANQKWCAICGAVLQLPVDCVIYPNLVCRSCDRRAVDQNGKPIDFGANSRALESGAWFMHEGPEVNPVFIDAHKCWRRYRFGGYVSMRDTSNCKSLDEFYEKTDGPWSKPVKAP